LKKDYVLFSQLDMATCPSGAFSSGVPTNNVQISHFSREFTCSDHLMLLDFIVLAVR